MKKIVRMGVITALIFVMITGNVFGDTSGYKPMKDGKFTTIVGGDKTQYAKDLGTIVNKSSHLMPSGAIYPKDTKYVNQVRPTSKYLCVLFTNNSFKNILAKSSFFLYILIVKSK